MSSSKGDIQYGDQNVTEDHEALIPPDVGSRRVSSSSTFLYLVVAVSLLAPISMGYTIGYSSPALPDMKEAHVLQDETWFGSLLNIGAIFGGPLAGILLGKYGRKVTVMMCAVPYVIGWALIASIESQGGLFVGRVLTGLAAGMTSLSCPVYIAEMASPDNRGFLGSSFQLCVTLGILMVYSLGLPLSYVWLAIVAAGLAFLLVVFMLPMPDTPAYWLIKKQRQRALAVLQEVRGSGVDVDIECREIESTLDNSDNSISWREFLEPHLFRPLGISLSLMFFQQFSGINTVMFYTVDIFKSTHSSIDPHVSTIIVGAVQVAATAVSVLLMDRLGRKVLLIVAGVMMAISSTSFGAYYYIINEVNNGTNTTAAPIIPSSPSMTLAVADSSGADLSWLGLSSMVVYIIGFSLGLGPIPWLLMSEIFPSKARGIASAIATAFNWMCSFIITKEFLALEGAFTQQGVFWMYAGVCVVEVLFVLFLVPETKGKSLEEIEDHFRKRE